MGLLDYAIYLITFALVAVIPGPGIAALIGQALATGFRPALIFIAGLILGDLTFLSLAVLGLGALAGAMSGLFVVIKIAGAGYLFYLAWRFWTAGMAPMQVSGEHRRPALATLAAGYAVTMSNPKVIVFYLALLPTVVDLNGVTPASYFGLMGCTMAVLAVVFGGYAAVAARARVVMATERARRWLNRGAAAAMAGAATFILIRE